MSINNFISTGWNSNGWKELKASFYREKSHSKFKITSISGRLCCLAVIPLHLAELLGVKSIVYGGAAGVCALKSVVQLGKAASGLCCGRWDTGLHLNKSKKQIIKAGGYVTSAIAAPFGQIARTVKAGAGVFHPGAYFKSNPDIINRSDSDNESGSDNESELQPVDAYFLDGKLFCDRTRIKENPRQALHIYAKNINFIYQVSFLKEKQASDSGGLTREFYTLVFAQLSKELNLSSGQKGMIQWSEENNELLEDIGVVFAQLCTYPFVKTGEVFHLDYFKYILAFFKNPLTENVEDFSEIEDDILLQILKDMAPPPPKESEGLIKFNQFYNENKDKKETDLFELKKFAKYVGYIEQIDGYDIQAHVPETLHELFAFLKLEKLNDVSDFDDFLSRVDDPIVRIKLENYSKDGLEADLKKLFKDLKELHEAITEERKEDLKFSEPQLSEGNRTRLKAIHTIVKRMQKSLGNETRRNLKKLTPEEFSQVIQGRFTREDFIDLMNKAEVEEKHQKVLTLITDWMKERTDEELQAFLQAITGSTSLPSQISVRINESYKYIQTSTCSKMLMLNPDIAKNPQRITDALNYLISDNAKSFQNA